MKHGRKTIICKICHKDKLHFGLGMCSACLRNWKRKNKPHFYLGTCYSEIRRRCITKSKIRPSYYGKKFCSKEEFFGKFLKDSEFLRLYKVWQDNDYKRVYAPSIDRINNDGDYFLDNLRFTTHLENSTKDRNIPVKVNNIIFKSQADASRYLNVSSGIVSNLLKHNKKYYKGYIIERA